LNFVIDTNILVSAVLKPDSTPGKALTLAKSIGEIVFCAETKAELLDVIARDKFDFYLDKRSRLESVNKFLISPIILKTDKTIQCRDEKDVVFLNVAIQTNATCIISGDQDLLIMNPFRGIPILKPSEFVSAYQKPE